MNPSERWQNEKEQKRLDAILEAMPDLVAVFSLDGTPRYFNHAGRTMLEIASDENLNALNIGDFLTPPMKEVVLNEGLPVAYLDGHWQGDAELSTRAGRAIPVQLTALSHADTDSEPAHYSLIARDITDREYYDKILQEQIQAVQESRFEMEAQQVELCKANMALSEANARLQALATTDGLTGLKNHRTFQEKLVEEFERCQRYRTPLSIALLDVDKFKAFNDSFGHPAGDGVLKMVAGIFQENARTTDFVARYGGEEFVVLLPGTDTVGASAAAERMRSAVEYAYWDLRPVTVSIGISTCKPATSSPAAFLAEADRALYASKQKGRNCVTHVSEMSDVTQKLSMVEFDGALSREAHLSQMLMQAHDATVESWSRLLNLRDKETEGHSERVTEMTVRLANLCGLNEQEILYSRWGALLHDIGKVGIPDSILLKPGALTEQEWNVMRRHPLIAFELLAPIDFLRSALDIPHYHHEKWDGTGYPHGIKGEAIPLSARLFAVVDVWDALRSDRPYRKGWPKNKVMAHLRAQAGTHFDPEAVRMFLRMVRSESHRVEKSETEPIRLAA